MPNAVTHDRSLRFGFDAESRVAACDRQKLGGELNLIKMRDSAPTGRGGVGSFPGGVARVMKPIDTDAAWIDGEIEQQIHECGGHRFKTRRRCDVARRFRLCARYQERA